MSRTDVSDDDPRESALERERIGAAVMARLFAGAQGSSPPRIGRFTLLDRLGEGAMGTVWSAYDPQLDRRVAIKLLHRADDDSRDDARVRREARAMASVNHPNVAHVYEVGSHEDRIFLAMEYIEGATLRRWQGSDGLSWLEILRVHLQAGRGLAAAHRAGIVHRDYKPDNVLVGDDGRVRVVDFGLAHSGPALEQTESDEHSDESTLTRRRAGTPAYMAPEQFHGEQIDGRADQFAWCVTLFEALAGSRPYAGKTASRLLQAIERGAVPLDRLPSRVPPWVTGALVRGLRPRAADRFASMEELLEELDRDPGRTRRRRLFALGLGVVLVGALALGRSTAPPPPEPCPDPSGQLQGVWDDDVRDRITTSLTAAAPSYAEATIGRLTTRLDDYTSQWIADRIETCEATRVRGEQSEARLDARMQCLDDRRRAVRALTRTLAEADAGVAERALRAAAALPTLEACADPRYIDAVHPLPDDSDLAAEVSAELDRFAQMRVMLDTGQFPAARELARAIEARAAELGYVPLSVRAEYAVGVTEATLANAAEAEARLQSAYMRSRREQMPELSLHAANDLALLLVRSIDRRAEGKLWARLSITESQVVGDRRQEANARNTLGLPGLFEGTPAALAEAKEEFERALTIAREEGETLRELGIRSNLARAIAAEGQLERAADLHERILADAEAYLGSEHPDLVAIIDSLAGSWYILGRCEELVPRYEQALRISVRARGEIHPHTTRLLDGRARCELRLGRLDAAKTHAEDAVRIGRAIVAAGGRESTDGTATLADVNLALQHYDEALALMRENLRQAVAIGGEHGRDANTSRYWLARALVEAKRFDEALEVAQDCVAHANEDLGPEHLETTGALHVRGDAYAALGQIDEAVADLKRAYELRKPYFPEDSPKHADLFVSLADAYLKGERFDEAHEAAEHAAELIDGAPDWLPSERGVLDFLRAQAVLGASGDRGHATRLVTSALQKLSDGPAAVQARRREVEAWARRHTLVEPS